MFDGKGGAGAMETISPRYENTERGTFITTNKIEGKLEHVAVTVFL